MYGEAEPDNVPDHRFPIEDPAGRLREVDHLLIADEPAVTVTATWKPPSQTLATVSAALHPPDSGVVVGVEVGVEVGVDPFPHPHLSRSSPL